MKEARPASSTGAPGLTIVIGVMNEEDNVAPLTDEMAEIGLPEAFDLELIMVDDGSTDRTVDVVRRQMAKYPWIRCIEHDRNYGKTATWLTGFPLATRETIVVMDGDLQNDPRDIVPMYETLNEGYDIVTGMRRKRQGRWRIVQSRIANHVRRFFLRDNALDNGCGLKMFRRSVLKDLYLFNGAHRFLESLVQMHGYRFRQILVEDRRRVHGVPKYGLRNRAIAPAIDMLGVWWLRKRLLHTRWRPVAPAAAMENPNRTSVDASPEKVIEPEPSAAVNEQ